MQYIYCGLRHKIGQSYLMNKRKLRIALITGGDNAEREISLKSADTIYKNLDLNLYKVDMLDFSNGLFKHMESGKHLHWSDFATDESNASIFDLVLLILHGIPAENGQLQAFFEMVGLNYLGTDHFSSALSFDKQSCKKFLEAFDVPMAKSILLHKNKGDDYSIDQMHKSDLFVKPNKNGSSYGVSKVLAGENPESAIEKAFIYDDEVIVEEFLEGREFSNGVFLSKDGPKVLPVTEIIPHGSFFDYAAKYKNESAEITPAEISDELSKKCQAQSLKIFEALQCKGFARFDYILVDNEFYFLEANTIPGMSAESLVPQQLQAAGISIAEMLDAIIEETLLRKGIKLTA